jgi:HD-GYP domain-containing protein (c-di-GMP phosphodiesterase class II)
MILARELGLDEQEIHDLQLGAILHDIGKYRIPDRILYKPGKLDEEEWEVMRQHPVYGAEFVRRITILAPAEAVVLHHHERWDGNGYPHGTTGEEIPLGARIFSVVDAFDAMCERRCYKEARSPDLALAELKRCAGTQFDPRVVEAFENAWPRILKVQDVGNRPAAPRSLWVDRPRPTTPEMLEAEVRRASGM